jgi:5-(aminomethyl)-3-furanmethanol phosphate kinase
VWLLKLGGSLLTSGNLERWLEWLQARSRRSASVLVVPGGGPFADAVRALQPLTRASELTAHRQALLAMQQFAWLLLERLPDAHPWKGGEGPAQEGVSVWLPAADHATRLDCPQDWRTTSDALALDLAVQLEASGLACVKSVAPGGAIARDACFDPVFVAHLERLRAPAVWLGPEDVAEAERLCTGGQSLERNSLAS